MSSALPPAVIDASIAWAVHFGAGEATPASRAAWQRWRAADPLHERAWQQLEAGSALRERARGLGAATALAALAAPASAGRRQALRMLGWTVVGGGAAWAGLDAAPWQAWSADLRTATGEQREVLLADGTRVLLNTDTALDVRFGQGLRALRLLHGEIFITTAADTADVFRPFVVDTPCGRVRALGTRFSVRHDARAAPESAVAVYAGAVELHPTQQSDAVLRLDAGEAGTLARDAARRADQALAAAQPDWAGGVLVASDMPLADFVAELRRYRPGVITLAPEVAQLRLSGVFPLADTDRILAALAQVLPVRVNVPMRWWARIGPLRS